MINARVRIIAAERGRVWVEPAGEIRCAGCSCGGDLWRRAFGLRDRSIAIATEEKIEAGEFALVSLEEGKLITALIKQYLLPLLLMLLFAALAETLVEGEVWVILGGVTGLLLGLIAARKSGLSIRPNISPIRTDLTPYPDPLRNTSSSDLFDSAHKYP